MKNIVFLCTLILLVSACKKEATTLAKPSNNESKATVSIDAIVDSALQNTTARSSVQYLRGWYNNEIVKNPGYQYMWVVIDQGSLPQAPRVKLYGPDHQTRYRTMQRSSNGAYWYLVSSLPKTGHYAWRYVSHNYTDLTSWNSWIDNTKVRINLNGTSNLVWPFGADGSNSNNRQGWYAANEQGSCGGSSHNQHGHIYHGCKADDALAMDWNRCSPYPSDNNAMVKSPLDGKVLDIKKTGTNGGYGKYIDIIQKYGNDDYIFRIAHLSTIPNHIQKNMYVRAGLTYIGNIGMTGGTSTGPHAHVVLYKLQSNGCYNGIGFDFNNY